MSEIAVVETGVANLASIANAFERLGERVTPTQDPAIVRRAARVVLPGVGAFGPAAAELRARGLDIALRDSLERGTPLLAVCLGLQLLCEGSEEAPGVPGLGIVPGTCRRLPTGVRVPHLGWNRVIANADERFVGSGEAAFANSYALGEAPSGWNASWTTYGAPFVAALERGDTLACQFHPELSGAYGAEVLARWLGRGDRSAYAAPPPRAAGLLRRIVPCLDVRDGRVVKGVNFQGLRDAGDPAERAARYEAQGADEIVMLDVTAAPGGRDTQVDTVRRVRAAIRIPLTVGGGVRSVADARRLLGAGADKLSVNTAAVGRPGLLNELADAFGRQCVVLAIDARRRGEDWEALVVGGRSTGRSDAVAWAAEGEGRGAGEILLTSWDADGTRNGHDLGLLRAVVDAVHVPVIASGGIGTRAHVVEALAAGADAVLAASVLHDGAETVDGIKAHVAACGIAVRRPHPLTPSPSRERGDERQ
jgi:imidazole glycerol phosphate synthase glutamine amidotransferase subunit